MNQSSVIKDYQYADEVLTLRMTNDVTYKYMGVPNTVYEEFTKSESKGKFFVQNIKPKFVFEKVQ